MNYEIWRKDIGGDGGRNGEGDEWRPSPPVVNDSRTCHVYSDSDSVNGSFYMAARAGGILEICKRQSHAIASPTDIRQDTDTPTISAHSVQLATSDANWNGVKCGERKWQWRWRWRRTALIKQKRHPDRVLDVFNYHKWLQTRYLAALASYIPLRLRLSYCSVWRGSL